MTEILHEPLVPLSSRRPCALVVIAFDQDDRILGVKKSRRFDLVRGAQEWDDDRPEDAARREVFEQAGVVLGAARLAGVIESMAADDGGPFQTLVLTGFVQSIEAVSAAREKRRSFIPVDKFLESGCFGEDRSKMKQLIDMALFYRVRQRVYRKRKHSAASV